MVFKFYYALTGVMTENPYLLKQGKFWQMKQKFWVYDFNLQSECFFVLLV